MLARVDNWNRLGDLFDWDYRLTTGVPDWTAAFSDKDGKFALKLEVPGFTEKDIKISVINGNLRVAGKCETVDDFSSASSFTRTFSLPKNIDLENIEAEMKNGILKVSLVKKELKGKEICVKLLK